MTTTPAWAGRSFTVAAGDPQASSVGVARTGSSESESRRNSVRELNAAVGHDAPQVVVQLSVAVDPTLQVGTHPAVGIAESSARLDREHNRRRVVPQKSTAFGHDSVDAALDEIDDVRRAVWCDLDSESSEQLRKSAGRLAIQTDACAFERRHH